VLLVLSLPASLLALAQLTPFLTWLNVSLAWTADQGALGVLVFTLIFVLVCVSALPEVYPNLAAGMIWGPLPGALVVSVARVVGCCFTFLLVRGVLRGWVARRIGEDARWRAVDALLEREGFKFVVLLRLCPIFPANVINFGFGVTGVHLGAYAAGTFVGMLPRSLVVAYLGAGGRSLADLAAADALTLQALPGPVFWAGLVVVGIGTLWVAAITRRMVLTAMAAHEAG
jgi:uncharacterized membrane protein YdjX (TVP38/TMEM64 family)